MNKIFFGKVGSNWKTQMIGCRVSCTVTYNWMKRSFYPWYTSGTVAQFIKKNEYPVI